MVDDQDRCEWVNVSFGTGSRVVPAMGRKAVACCCFCLFVSDFTYYEFGWEL